MSVTDDGRGFDTSDLRGFVRSGHYGLAGMRERVEMTDGTLGVMSAPGSGTTITAIVPSTSPAPLSIEVAS